MAIPSPAALWKFARSMERVFELDEAVRDGFAKTGQTIKDIEARFMKIEANQLVLTAEVRAAAMTAGSAAATLHTAELSRQIGILQEQVRTLREGPGTPQRAIGSTPRD